MENPGVTSPPVNGLLALGILLALVAAATAAGLVWRATTGRARRGATSATSRTTSVVFVR